MDRAVDILHPLTSLEWRQCRKPPVCIDNSAQAVWLKDKVYVGGGAIGSLAKLYIYTPATDTWTFLYTSAYYFALTTYHSQLVLAVSRRGTVGFLVSLVTPLNVDGPSTGQWQETLPPIPTQLVPRGSEVGGRVSLFSFVSAVSHGDHLVVIGTSDQLSNKVFVYNGHHWASAQHPPLKLHYDYMRSTVFNGHLYLMGGAIVMTSVCSAPLDSLLASCQPSETSQPSSVWKRLTDVPSGHCYPAVFGNRLVAVGKGSSLTTISLHAYSSSTQSWVHIGDAPSRFTAGGPGCAVALPSNELMVMSGDLMFKATLKSNKETPSLNNILADSEMAPPDPQPERENPQPRRSIRVRAPPDYLRY